MVYFDPTTHNDIPGMGYIAAAFFGGFYALVFYFIRSYRLRRRARMLYAASRPESEDLP